MNSSFKVIRSRYAEAEICSLQVLLAFAHQLQTFVLSPSFSFDLLLLHPLQKLSWVPCLNIYELCEAHWGLNACWILIQKINPEQEIREWGLPCRRSDKLWRRSVPVGSRAAVNPPGLLLELFPPEVSFSESCSSHGVTPPQRVSSQLQVWGPNQG